MLQFLLFAFFLQIGRVTGSLSIRIDERKWEGQLHMRYVSRRGQLRPTAFSCHAHLAPAIILSCAKGLSLLQGSLALSGSYR